MTVSYAQLKQRLDAGEVIILDGATGTELQRRGAKMSPEAWCGPASLDNADLLTEVHLDYIRAGSDVITTNTYASSRMMLTPAGFGDRIEEINKVAIDAALRARDRAPDGRAVAVGGCLSHMVPHIAGTDLVDPERTPGPAEMSEAFHELAGLLKSGGVDHIMLEMMYEPTRTPLAVEAALSTGLPVWFGLSSRFDDNGKVVSFNLASDIPLQPIIDCIPDRGVDVVNIMHTQSNVVSDTIDLVRTKFSGPIGAYPDSGYFEMPNWNFSEVIEPSRLKTFYSEWLDKGVQLLGGCCGLTVGHIEAANAARNERR
jgi:homocysteine S-methyltransferase